MTEEHPHRWHCASCARPLSNATSICLSCDASLTIAPKRVENAGPYVCPECGWRFQAPDSVLTPQDAPWYYPQSLKPACPHCHVLLADRRQSWPLMPLLLLLFLALASLLPPGAGGVMALVMVGVNIGAERRWRNQSDRYALPAQILASTGLLPTAQPFTWRCRMVLLWQMGFLAAGLHLVLMVLFPNLWQQGWRMTGHTLVMLQGDSLPSAGWVLAALLPAGVGWVLPRCRLKAWARGTIGLWVVVGVCACVQGQATLGLSFLLWATYTALMERKLR